MKALLCLLVLVLVHPALAQRESFRVDDLLLSDRHPYGQQIRVGSISEKEDDGPEPRFRKWLLVGEQELLDQPPAAMTSDLLTAMVSRLTGVGEDQLAVKDGWLVASGGPAERIGPALARIRSGLAGHQVDVQIQLRKRQADKVTVLLDGMRRCEAGATLVFEDHSKHAAVADFEVEIAQSATVANPVIMQAVGGSSVAVRARRVPGTDSAACEVVVRTNDADVTGEIDLGNVSLKKADRIQNRLSRCGFAFLVTRGKPVTHRWLSANGHVLELSLMAKWRPRANQAVAGSLVMSSLPEQPVRGFHWTEVRHSGETRGPRPNAVHGAVRAVLHRRNNWRLSQSESRIQGILFAGDGANKSAVQLVQALRSALVGLQLDVQVLDCPAGVKIESGKALPDGVKVLGLANGPVLSGLSSCFVGHTERTYVADWDCEVAQSSRIPDPKIDVCYDGYYIDATVTADAAGRTARLELECLVRDSDISRSKLVDMAAAQKTPPTTSSRSAGKAVTVDLVPSQSLPREQGRVELLVERRKRVAVSAGLVLGTQKIIRRTARSLLGDGRELVVVVNVK